MLYLIIAGAVLYHLGDMYLSGSYAYVQAAAKVRARLYKISSSLLKLNEEETYATSDNVYWMFKLYIRVIAIDSVIMYANPGMTTIIAFLFAGLIATPVSFPISFLYLLIKKLASKVFRNPEENLFLRVFKNWRARLIHPSCLVNRKYVYPHASEHKCGGESMASNYFFILIAVFLIFYGIKVFAPMSCAPCDYSLGIMQLIAGLSVLFTPFWLGYGPLLTFVKSFVGIIFFWQLLESIGTELKRKRNPANRGAKESSPSPNSDTSIGTPKKRYGKISAD